MDSLQLSQVAGMRFPNGRHTRLVTGAQGLSAKGFVQGYVVMPPGSGVAEHEHHQEEVYLFLSGCGEIRVGDETSDVTEGSAVYIESGVKHALRNTGNEDLVMVFTYAPAGEVGHWTEELAGRLK